VPQSYSASEGLAHARIESATSAPAGSKAKVTERRESDLFPSPTMVDPVNLGGATGIQTRGKAAKKAQKKAQQAKWAGADNEDGAKNGEGGNDGEGGGGNDGEGGGGGDGGRSGGAGGNGDGGAGGDEGDDWDFGGKKNKKNKKKGKQEEEEEKKAQEEEEEEEEEEKKKAEEDAVAANSLSWANETNDATMNDEWALSSKKDKKKKSKKVSPNASLTF